MIIHPFLLGTGMAGQAILKSLEIIKLIYPELDIKSPTILKRDSSFEGLTTQKENPVLFIANPSALHAEAIIKAEAAGFKTIVCEKPVVTDLGQIDLLKKVKSKVAVLHGYRMMWGPQTLKQMLEAGEFGQIISLESRYWQSSVAQKALTKTPERAPWKADAALNGQYDVLLDLGSHWMDLMLFFAGDKPQKVDGKISYINGTGPMRDTHLNLNLYFESGIYATGSISKTVHGMGNSLEVNILGSLKSASWNFLNPDEIIIGEGANQKILKRTQSLLGGKQNPFHGLGWIDGYIEVIAQTLLELQGRKANYPHLSGSLEMMEILLKAQLVR
jgi:predicted dehydrogenase